MIVKSWKSFETIANLKKWRWMFSKEFQTWNWKNHILRRCIAHGNRSKHTVGEPEAALVQNAEVKQLKY